MKKIFFALMLGLAAVACTPEYDDTDLKNRMDQIEKDFDAFDASLESLMTRIAAAEAAVEAVNKAIADADFVVSVVASEEGDGVVVSFKKADPLFIPLDLDASKVDGVVISDVVVEGETATFTYTDGTKVEMPLYHEKEFALTIADSKFTVAGGATVKIPYTVTEGAVVDVLASTPGYVAVVEESEIVVTVPDPFVKGEVLVWADNGAGKSSIKKISFSESNISVEEVAEVPAEGGSVVIKGASNVVVTAEVVEGADWLTAAPAAKAEFSFAFTAAANEGAARTAKVALKNGENVLYTVTVAQAAAGISAELVWKIATINAGSDRNMTMDAEYVYVAKAAAGEEGIITAISLADPTVVKEIKFTAHNSGKGTGTHAVSCVRMLPNDDPAVNNGKPVLVASNLAQSNGQDVLTFYAWEDGIDAAPKHYVSLDTGARRLGDKFTVKGTYKQGEIWLRDYNNGANAAIRINVKPGEITQWGGYASGRFNLPLGESQESIGEVYAHPEATFDGAGNPGALLVTSNTVAGFFTTANPDTPNTFAKSDWTVDPELAQTFGYNFFEYDGKDYIAYVKISADRAKASLNIIEDVNGAADFKGTLEAQKGLFTDASLSGSAGHGVGDCATVEVNGVRYIAIMGQNMGVALYKVL